MLKVIDGKGIAEEIKKELLNRKAPERFFAAIQIGENEASARFVERKKKFAEGLGVEFKTFKLSEEIGKDRIEEAIGYLAREEECGSIMIQLPLPSFIDKGILSIIPPDKDADALSGRSLVLPPSVLVVKEIIEREEADIQNSVIAIVGLGSLVGQPVSEWANKKFKEVIVLDKGDSKEKVRSADIVVLGAGDKGIISPEMLKDNSMVIDFGCSFDESGKICGDFDPQETEKDIAYTPTPGGTGPILIAKLFENFYSLNE
ncbi:MAG: bifunctional 5,10-methylenetetrahydrofolate dehydrogenase/5,10-methenyltetrahydrofolate cyclohydrolase [Candidatus Colwellbacteria bacterium]|nr:bifunctional 5,10-methylenetetrahydrofolate dehydrogenase/5,10-methenyltetrahydrofolate cyclohydrolase [Candidatus Colwellbacteria bacterium]